MIVIFVTLHDWQKGIAPKTIIGDNGGFSLSYL